MTEEPESDDEVHPLRKRVDDKLAANQRKSEMLHKEYGVGLNAQSAFNHRLLMLVQEVIPDVDPNLPVPVLLEHLINHILGPVEETEGFDYEARMRFEIRWQDKMRVALEEAHNEAVQEKKAEQGKKLIIPNNHGKGLHLP